MDDFFGLWSDFESSHSATSEEQGSTEQECSHYLRPFSCYNHKTIKRLREEVKIVNDEGEVCVMREQHVKFLLKGLDQLRSGFVSLDASKPWIIYWILHALHLLHADPYELAPRVVSTLAHMQHTGDKARGGFAGGPGQIAHCAPTYAAVLALCTVGTVDAYECIDRKAIYRFFLHMRHSSGGFTMHDGGEVDSRCTYTVRGSDCRVYVCVCMFNSLPLSSPLFSY